MKKETKEKLAEIIILAVAWIMGMIIISGCSANKSSIIDIRDHQEIELGTIIPEGQVNRILNFRGYDSSFKFENQLLSAQGRYNEIWRPY